MLSLINEIQKRNRTKERGEREREREREREAVKSERMRRDKENVAENGERVPRFRG